LPGCWPGARPEAAERTDRLARAVERLGPSWVKLGQFLATRPDVVGAEIADDLAGLQDRMATFPEALGPHRNRRFAWPADQRALFALRSADCGGLDSPGPSRRGHRRNGTRQVAVKVVRPGVRQRFRRDLEAFYLVSELQERFIPSSRRLRPVEITRTLEQTTRIEMDLRLEAAALSEMADNTRDDPGFRVPAVDWERTGRDVRHHGMDRRHQDE
jgi:ubiquinone biosynthesis protein